MRRKTRRPTIGRKIALALSAVVSLGLLAMSAGDAQFAKFHDRYQQLVTTREERDLAHRIKTDYARFKEQGGQLLVAKDAQEESYTTIGRNFERMDQALEAPPAPKALSRWWSQRPVAG